ncbi:hypothetical protein KKF05_05265 [Patescibacteria group bacterium]|nr:hypothetical protein [Patescibacteria group bacterium]MBU1029131.1 hypothetical protein [Patescibacteria group bacterium]
MSSTAKPPSLVINPSETQSRLEKARANRRHGEVLQLDKVLDLERQLLGDRAQYSGIVPPAFFVRSYQLDDQGLIDWCEPFFIPEVFSGQSLTTSGKLIAPAGDYAEAVREPCPRCGRPALVIGEYYHDIQPLSLIWWTLRFYLYCQHCPGVTDFALREEQTWSFEKRLRHCRRG